MHSVSEAGPRDMPVTQVALPPWVRVIVVNYNCGSMLQACVDALARQSMTDFEVVILDNGSTDGSADALQLPDDRFTVMRSTENTGFAAANNIAAKQCAAPWIATLNPDTVAAGNWLEEMRRAVGRHPDCQMFGATLIDAADGSLVDGFGDVLSIAGIAWRGDTGRPVAELPATDERVFGPCAAAAMFDRRAFEASGGFDETFFCYVEDVDLAFRLRLRGGDCVQVRSAVVRHHGSATTGRLSPFVIFHSFRNRLWMIKKNMPALLLPVAVASNVLLSLTMMVMSSRKLPVRAALKGLWCGLSQPCAKGQRQLVQSGRRISALQLARMLVWNPSALRRRRVEILGSS